MCNMACKLIIAACLAGAAIASGFAWNSYLQLSMYEKQLQTAVSEQRE